MLLPHCCVVDPPLRFAITHQLLLRSIYHPLLIENTHPLWLKKATHIKTEGHAISESWLAVRKRAYSTLLWRAFWTCRIGACLITLPSPVLKYLSFCVSIPPIIITEVPVTKALGGHHENCCWVPEQLTNPLVLSVRNRMLSDCSWFFKM